MKMKYQAWEKLIDGKVKSTLLSSFAARIAERVASARQNISLFYLSLYDELKGFFLALNPSHRHCPAVSYFFNPIHLPSLYFFSSIPTSNLFHRGGGIGFCYIYDARYIMILAFSRVIKPSFTISSRFGMNWLIFSSLSTISMIMGRSSESRNSFAVCIWLLQPKPTKAFYRGCPCHAIFCARGRRFPRKRLALPFCRISDKDS